MGNQTVLRTGKTLVSLLSFLDIMSITAMAVSANTDISKFIPLDKKDYIDGYNEEFRIGSSTGYNAGTKNGYNDCQNGLGNKSGSSGKSSLAPKSGVAFDLGYADGFNNGYRQGHSTSYKAEYNGYYHEHKSRKP